MQTGKGYGPTVAIFVLTGGIGSGKSSVLSGLVRRGAVAIDADKIVACLQSPGEAVFDSIVDRFGPRVVDQNGNLDRAYLSSVVFSDKTELRDLEEIVHPAVEQVILDRLASYTEQRSTSPVVVDIPLVDSREKRFGESGLIVVDCPYQEAVRRLTTYRGMSPKDAQSRIDNQISRRRRVELADFVLDNGGTHKQLDEKIDQCWLWIESKS